jgi:hypothetical protein
MLAVFSAVAIITSEQLKSRVYAAIKIYSPTYSPPVERRAI